MNIVCLENHDILCLNRHVIHELRRRIGREELDYQALMGALSDYASPRDRVTALLGRGDLIRVKKGLYVFGERARRRPYSREVLANMMYGPSFVSLHSALSFHGLIPERTEAVTSVTARRPKTYDTPVGRFVYRSSPKEAFHLGMDRVAEGDVAFLIATPERALADTIRDDRGHELRSLESIGRYLLDDLRIDTADLRRLDPDRVEDLGRALGSRKVRLCARFLRRLGASG